MERPGRETKSMMASWNLELSWVEKRLRPSLPRALLALAALLGSQPWEAAGQSDLPLVLSAGTHALTVPWYPAPLATGLNPAFMMGTDHGQRSGGDWSFFFGLNLGFFRDRWWMSGVSVEPEVGYGGRFGGGFHADVRIGLGYLHYFWRRERLELEGGEYLSRADYGHPSLILPLSVSLGYRGDADDPVEVAPFITGRWGIQGLFLETLPAMTHLSVLGGVRIDRGRNTPGGGG